MLYSWDFYWAKTDADDAKTLTVKRLGRKRLRSTWWSSKGSLLFHFVHFFGEFWTESKSPALVLFVTVAKTITWHLSHTPQALRHVLLLLWVRRRSRSPHFQEDVALHV